MECFDKPSGKQELNQSCSFLLLACDLLHKQPKELNINHVMGSISPPVNVIKVNIIHADAGMHINYTALLRVVASIQLSMSILLALMLPGTRETGLARRCVCVMSTISSCCYSKHAESCK